MHQLTTITRTNNGPMPEALMLLSAPLIGDAASPETEPLGQVEGAIIDEAGHVAFFVVRAANHKHLTGKRVLVPLAAVTIEEALGTTLNSGKPRKLIMRTAWTRDQLIAQPDFSEDHQLPKNRTDGSPPVDGRWAPAVPNIIPPGSGVNSAKAARFAFSWGALGAVGGIIAGVIIGYLAGSTFAAVATGVFFGLAAGIAGAIAGATRDSAVDAGEIHAMNPATSGPGLAVTENAGTAGLPFVRRFEEALQDQSMFQLGVVKATMILPTMQKARETEQSRAPSIVEASKPLRT